MSVEIEFTEDTKVNKAKVPKGTKLRFTESVAKQYIDNGVAKKPTVSKPRKEKAEK